MDFLGDRDRIMQDISSAPDFSTYLRDQGCAPLVRGVVTTLQVNVGKLCNQACHHCHVEAGPNRTEIMDERTVDRLLHLLERSPDIGLVDITGGAPEMNEHFSRIVSTTRDLGRKVTVRSNLTVLSLQGQEDTIGFFVEHGVKVIASLPCYTADNVDSQRGSGVFDASILALQRLNDVGYGEDGSGLEIDLVYNPLGAFLPPEQSSLEAAYKERLLEDFGIRFNRLYTITNMPIKRFSEMLARQDKETEYMDLLVRNFNPGAVSEVMCRDIVSVGWDGQLFDCDFNQMLELPLGVTDKAPRTLWDVASFASVESDAIRTASHCFGCTAGAGSSCGGSLT